jgi:hypothetical protein
VESVAKLLTVIGEKRFYDISEGEDAAGAR